MNDAIKEFGYFSFGQKMVFLAVYSGIKKSMDVWIPEEKFAEFQDFCKKYTLLINYDIKFIEIQDSKNIKSQVIGGKSLTTTKMHGKLLDDTEKGSVHVFLAMKQEYLDDIYKSGWYPIISDNRVIKPSFHDSQDFGAALGYPFCCRKFFFERNNWLLYSFLWEIFKNSLKFDYRCNCLWKDNRLGESYSYIYHMPCSFDCPDSIEYANKIEKILKETNPKLLHDCRYYLKLPCLVIREQKIYAFEGEFLQENTLKYTKYFFLGNPHEGNLSSFLEAGNTIICTTGTVDIYCDTSLLYSYDCKQQSDIEIPFFIKFE